MRPKGYLKIILLINFGLWHGLYSQTDEMRFGKLSEGLKAFAKGSKMGFMNEANQVVLPPTFYIGEFSKLPQFSEGLCIVFETPTDSYQDEIKYGFIDKSFKTVIPFIYEYSDGLYCNEILPEFELGRTIVSLKDPKTRNDFFYIINKEGQKLSDKFENWAGCTAACIYFPEISESLCAATKNGFFGYINSETGATSIPFTYTQAGPFSGGIAAVEIDNRYVVFIDKTGGQALPQKFVTAQKHENSAIYHNASGCGLTSGFVNDRIILRYYDKDGTGPVVYGLIDRKGNVVEKLTEEEFETSVKWDKYKWDYSQN
jgi:hypothetical protein